MKASGLGLRRLGLGLRVWGFGLIDSETFASQRAELRSAAECPETKGLGFRV